MILPQVEYTVCAKELCVLMRCRSLRCRVLLPYDLVVVVCRNSRVERGQKERRQLIQTMIRAVVGSRIQIRTERSRDVNVLEVDECLTKVSVMWVYLYDFGVRSTGASLSCPRPLGTRSER